MDLIALAFYATVCGLLSLFAPQIGGMLPRLGIGAIVGVAAASVLPWLKGLMAAPY